MGKITGISWKDATFNPWIGCAKVMCYAWNNHYMVGILVAFEPQPFDPVAGRLAGRTTSKAYVRNGEAVVDLERHGTINLIMNEVFPI